MRSLLVQPVLLRSSTCGFALVLDLKYSCFLVLHMHVKHES